MATSICVYVCVCMASNLDTAFPLLKKGNRGSLFGLSVALHEHLHGNAHLLLVGAPREKAEPHLAANRTGGVYSCPITASQSDCSRINLIGSGEDLVEAEDWIEDMWLGVSVASQGRPGGRILVCGHRFIKIYGAYRLRHMIGKCYLRGNDLQYDPEDMPWQNPDQICSHLLEVSDEVMCNMGISAAITQSEFIVGSPGSYEWQGNVHVSWMNSLFMNTQQSSLANMHRRNIYIGYSVTQAPHLLSHQTMTIVTGAPKDTKEDGRGSVLLALKRSNMLVVQQTLRGQQMGSYFGNAIAAIDLNNNRWNDLLVGAPFYFHGQEAGGAVYVYLNAGGWFESRPSMVLHGPAGSAFGMSVANAGDLNQDGFQDFAVGAPFHGTGTVMIWTGSAEGISTTPSQVIAGSRISSAFRTFGYSLSGGLDVDGNKYPDLLVGSLDDTVALLRTRPVIHLNQTLKVSPEIIDPNGCNDCVQVEVCVSYIVSTGEPDINHNLTVNFTVTADITHHSSRICFLDNRHGTYSGFLSLPWRRCEILRAGLLSSVRDKVEPLVFSMNVSLYENLPKKKRTVQNLDHFPVLGLMPQPIRTQVHIQKACGSDYRCHSNLQMKAQFTDENHKPFATQNGTQRFSFDSSVTRLLLEVNISNMPSPGHPAEDAHATALNVSIPPQLIYAGVRTKGDGLPVDCSVDDRILMCELGNPFRSSQKVQLLIIFQTSEISLDTRQIQSVLQLSTLSEQSHLYPVLVRLKVEFQLQTSLTLIKHPGHTHFSGHMTGESIIKSVKDIGSPLDFTFQVDVMGKPLGYYGNLAVEFDWPLESSSGKWLLYLTEILLGGTSEPYCTPPTNIINPLNLTLSQETKKRSLEEEDKQARTRNAALPLQRRSSTAFTLDCVHGARCVTFTCPLVNMNNSATLTVRSRLWKSTMIEDFSTARSVLVQGRATLKLLTDKPTISITDSSQLQFQVVIHPEQSMERDNSVLLWILVLSVLTGVGLLALICLLLWKCGFFVRQRAWQAVMLHQGRIMGKENQQQHYTDADGFVIRELSSSRNRMMPKPWITSWTETITH
ncbi:integrin alpha-3-like [Thalassophryne amazonica]|uniref:integrin alpha-3-like n=1 Tax=Thalassophryne amazonica TaxID=390379 RepID=UPI001470B64A|nr:integrin alpha-3-like [Thalassophryne amazonica]